MHETHVDSAPRSSGQRVLIVEDDDDVRDVLEELIAAFGHEPLAAATADEAVRHASELPVAVALVDLGLPEVDGYEVARRLRASAWGASMRLIALTGYSDRETRKNATEAGFDSFLVKPADPAAIQQLLSIGAVAPAVHA